MSLFDYDVLKGKCSKYETNHLHMYVDDDIDMENMCNMTLSAYATFVHEYMHYIQHFTSLYGVRMSCMYNRMFQRYLDYIISKKTIKIPLRLWETDDEIGSFITRYNNIEGNKDTAFNISDIEIDEQEILNARANGTAVWIGCYDFDNDKAEGRGFRFGHRCIVEGMAHSIQSIINPEVVHDIVPYRTVELIIGKIIPGRVGDKRLIASICLCALFWDNPGVGFFDVLELLKQNPNWNGKDLYKSIIRGCSVSHKGQSKPLYRLLADFSEDLKTSLEVLMGTDLEYYSQVIINSVRDCGRCHHQFLDFLYDCDISDREVFRKKILNHYGYPFIDGKNNCVFPMKFVNGKQLAYSETAILYGFELIMDSVLLKDGKKQCKRYRICSSNMFKVSKKCDVEDECISSPWTKKEKCIFTEALGYFGIKDKVFQY